MVGGIGPLVGLIGVYLAWGTIPAWTLWTYLLVRTSMSSTSIGDFRVPFRLPYSRTRSTTICTMSGQAMATAHRC